MLDAATTSALHREESIRRASIHPAHRFEKQPGGGTRSAKWRADRKCVLRMARRRTGRRRTLRLRLRRQGRLISATEKTSVPPTRRLVVRVQRTGRVIGRRTEYTTVTSPRERLEARRSPQILAADGAPRNDVRLGPSERSPHLCLSRGCRERSSQTDHSRRSRIRRSARDRDDRPLDRRGHASLSDLRRSRRRHDAGRGQRARRRRRPQPLERSIWRWRRPRCAARLSIALPSTSRRTTTARSSQCSKNPRDRAVASGKRYVRRAPGDVDAAGAVLTTSSVRPSLDATTRSRFSGS